MENIREPKIKYSYNDQKLGIIKKKEIANLRKQITVIREKYKNEEKMIEIEELKKLREQRLELRDVCGVKDPTPYEAVEHIRKEQAVRKKAV